MKSKQSLHTLQGECVAPPKAKSFRSQLFPEERRGILEPTGAFLGFS